MSGTTQPVLTGGCQCGAIRFAVSTQPTRIGVCHCRMCQKATGAPFASLADIPEEHVTWTRGKPATFQSSSLAMRDFCAACGTPLAYRMIGRPRIEIATGAFDRPQDVIPNKQFGTESRLDWVMSIADLPGATTSDNFGAEKTAKIVSFQHPDHD